MDLISKLLTKIDNISGSITPAVSDSLINLKSIEQRETVINELVGIRVALDDLMKTLDERIHHAKQVHSKEIAAVDNFMRKLKKEDPVVGPVASVRADTLTSSSPPSSSRVDSLTPKATEDSWTKIVRGKKQTAKAEPLPKVETRALSVAPPPGFVQPAASSATAVATATNERMRVKFTEALALEATKVLTFDQVRSDGKLYYVESADHLAFRLEGMLLHGNIGVIYTEHCTPEKIRSCRFADDCIKKNRCDYYHDPSKFPGSRDHRNFVASSWLYAPPGSQYQQHTKSRRFGSRNNLDTDIVQLTEEEITRYYDQTMHDMLCCMLLNSYTRPH